jgi:hypothetical protein
MDEFESLYWDLAQVAGWALTREPDAVRTSADRSNENALFEVRAAHLARWGEVNALLWIESGWTVPARVAAVEIIAGGVADEVTMIPSLSDERYAARLRQLQAEGKIRLRQDDTFPINDYLRALFQTGRLTAYHHRTVYAGRMRSRRPAGPSSKSSAVIMSALRSGASANTASAARQSETSKSQAGKSSRYFRQSVNLARRPRSSRFSKKRHCRMLWPLLSAVSTEPKDRRLIARKCGTQSPRKYTARRPFR